MARNKAPPGANGSAESLMGAAVDAFLERLGRGERPDPEEQEYPMTWLLLALAHQRAGHTEEAGNRLRQARQWIEKATRKTPEGATALPGLNPLPWTARLGLRRPRREAEAQVGDATPGGEGPKEKWPSLDFHGAEWN